MRERAGSRRRQISAGTSMRGGRSSVRSRSGSRMSCLPGPRQQALEKVAPSSLRGVLHLPGAAGERAPRRPPRIAREARRPRRCTTRRRRASTGPCRPRRQAAPGRGPTRSCPGLASAPRKKRPGASGAPSWNTRENRAAARRSAIRLAAASGSPGSESYSTVCSRAATSSGGGTPAAADRYSAARPKTWVRPAEELSMIVLPCDRPLRPNMRVRAPALYSAAAIL